MIEEELESNGEVFRAPTAPEGEASTVQKQNYSAIFDRGVFTGQAKLPKRYRDGRIAKNGREHVVYERGPHNSFIHEIM